MRVLECLWTAKCVGRHDLFFCSSVDTEDTTADKSKESQAAMKLHCRLILLNFWLLFKAKCATRSLWRLYSMKNYLRFLACFTRCVCDKRSCLVGVNWYDAMALDTECIGYFGSRAGLIKATRIYSVWVCMCVPRVFRVPRLHAILSVGHGKTCGSWIHFPFKRNFVQSRRRGTCNGYCQE